MVFDKRDDRYQGRCSECFWGTVKLGLLLDCDRKCMVTGKIMTRDGPYSCTFFNTPLIKIIEWMIKTGGH